MKEKVRAEETVTRFQAERELQVGPQLSMITAFDLSTKNASTISSWESQLEDGTIPESHDFHRALDGLGLPPEEATEKVTLERIIRVKESGE